MSDVFLPYYCGGEVIMYKNDCYYLTKDTKQFLLIFNKPLC